MGGGVSKIGGFVKRGLSYIPGVSKIAKKTGNFFRGLNKKTKGILGAGFNQLHEFAPLIASMGGTYGKGAAAAIEGVNEAKQTVNDLEKHRDLSNLKGDLMDVAKEAKNVGGIPKIGGMNMGSLGPKNWEKYQSKLAQGKQVLNKVKNTSKKSPVMKVSGWNSKIRKAAKSFIAPKLKRAREHVSKKLVNLNATSNIKTDLN